MKHYFGEVGPTGSTHGETINSYQLPENKDRRKRRAHENTKT